MNEWKGLSEIFIEEQEERLNTKPSELCSYGIKPLDDALLRIGKNELVVIGADSGSGKTEVALTIALTNVLAGRKVAFYHLEGGASEAMARMKWKSITEKYFAKPMGIDIDYRAWKLHLGQDHRLLDLETAVYEDWKEKLKDNLYLYSSNDPLTIDSFLNSLTDFHTFKKEPGSEVVSKHSYGLDLIIVDHLQYFSLTQSENEITEITKILREVKNIADCSGIPVVLVSHLRKKGKDRGIPGQEDFYGSSNIPKIASTAITISQASAGESHADGIYPTYFRICKSRIGIRPNLAIMVDFYLHGRSYAEAYKLYRLDEMGNRATEELKPEELPKWARKS